MRIEFGKFKANDLCKQHVLECLDNGWVSIGPKTKLFEEKFAALFGYKHCKAVSSGTSAGMAACMTLYDLKGAQPGDEVICPALTFIATGNAIRAAGFVPVFVDVGFNMNINVDLIEQAITPKTKAIKAVSLIGRPPKLDKLREIADKHDLLLIVDNCEGYGSKYKGKHALEYADIETSSHYSRNVSKCKRVVHRQ
jgi:CDP-6-deoxy-D-xylo-4-hexulose-3-dehydrase